MRHGRQPKLSPVILFLNIVQLKCLYELLRYFIIITIDLIPCEGTEVFLLNINKDNEETESQKQRELGFFNYIS